MDVVTKCDPFKGFPFLEILDKEIGHKKAAENYAVITVQSKRTCMRNTNQGMPYSRANFPKLDRVHAVG